MPPLSSPLPPRYEIRPLLPAHTPWANALIMHASLFASPVWSAIFTDPPSRTKMCYAMFKSARYLMSHQINSGLSLGIFDTQYNFTRPESAGTGGKLYWDLEDESADEKTLLEQMDFPLVSVALAYDSFEPFDAAEVKELLELLPQLGVRNRALQARDERDARKWEATGPGQVMFRNGTATKAGEGEKGFMKVLAKYMMRKAAEEGFRGIQILCLHDAVNHVWTHPPNPYRAEVVASFNCASDEDEGIKQAFRGSDQEITKVYVTLKT